MPRRKRQILTEPTRDGRAIKVRLDARTVVTIQADRFDHWKARYPNAKVLN